MKNYSVRIYDTQEKKFDETKQEFSLKEARATAADICKKLNKKYGILVEPSRFAVVVIRNGKIAFPEINKDLLGIEIR